MSRALSTNPKNRLVDKANAAVEMTNVGLGVCGGEGGEGDSASS